jgi:3-deoxy-D-manno-octulosonic acid kinase
MNERLLHTAQGGILYEPSAFGKSERYAPRHELIAADYWLKQQLATPTRGGRGSVLFIHDEQHTPPLRWVLRHYRRGGLVARLLNDRYLWLGESATRAFREWRLLAALRARYLPVPVPIAASYVRNGLSYRADLITQEIFGAHSLTQRLSETNLPAELWQRIGMTLARFHVLGVLHADLNANNIMIDAMDEVHVLDFDRGRIVNRDARWIRRVLARLLHSLNKLQAQSRLHFTQADWQLLMSAHDKHLERLSKQQS